MSTIDDCETLTNEEPQVNLEENNITDANLIKNLKQEADFLQNNSEEEYEYHDEIDIKPS